MKYVLLNIIRLYWLLIPKSNRRKCIFEKTCSNQVFDETRNNGFRNGLNELIFRIKNCHPEFDIYTDYKTNEKKMLLKTGITIDENQIAKRLR